MWQVRWWALPPLGPSRVATPGEGRESCFPGERAEVVGALALLSDWQRGFLGQWCHLAALRKRDDGAESGTHLSPRIGVAVSGPCGPSPSGRAHQAGPGAPVGCAFAHCTNRRVHGRCRAWRSRGVGPALWSEPLLPRRRVFYKVKSRSAHMKSHAEQEKKAAALRQKEKEAAAAAATAAANSPHQPALREESGAGERGWQPGVGGAWPRGRPAAGPSSCSPRGPPEGAPRDGADSALQNQTVK